MSVQKTTEPDDVNVGLVATVTLVGAFLVLAIALSLTALVRSEATLRGNESGAFADLGAVHRLKAEQRAKLEASPAWLDRAKGEVALPIYRAMEMVTADIQKDPSHATAVAAVAPATPAPAAAPEGSAASAPGPAPTAPSPANVPAPAPQK
jgi:hypothetical protein